MWDSMPKEQLEEFVNSRSKTLPVQHVADADEVGLWLWTKFSLLTTANSVGR
jgi:hypothetical protein